MINIIKKIVFKLLDKFKPKDEFSGLFNEMSSEVNDYLLKYKNKDEE